jgi:hypothetical protein
MPNPLEPAPPWLIIRNTAWLVAWDETARSHVYRRDVDLTIEGETIAAIGPAGQDVISCSCAPSLLHSTPQIFQNVDCANMTMSRSPTSGATP